MLRLEFAHIYAGLLGLLARDLEIRQVLAVLLTLTLANVLLLLRAVSARDVEAAPATSRAC